MTIILVFMGKKGIIPSMNKKISVLVQSNVFQTAIIATIFAASILMGFETYTSLYRTYHSLFRTLDIIIQMIFTVEIGLRILAFGNKPLDFFRSGLNVFDFAVTALFYLPFGGSYVAVFRLVRLFRVFRLVTALPNLQLLVGALLKSIPSIGYVAVLLFIQFYIFAIIGHFQFGAHDPENFGNLGVSLMTLFEVVTLEGWVDIYKAQPNVVAATVYFISFILLGTMIVMNLFIGVILNGFDEVHKEIEEQKHKGQSNLKTDLKSLSRDISAMKDKLDRLASKVS